MALTARGDHGKRAPESAFAESEANPVANKDLGTKQTCPSCEVKFYDLNKRPAICPKCAASFDPEDDAVKAKTKTSAAAEKPDTKTPEVQDDEDKGKDAETGAEDEDEEEDPEAAKELGGDVEEVVLEGSDTSDDDEDAGPGGVPAGFSETGVDDDDIIDDEDEDAAVLTVGDDVDDLIEEGGEDEEK